MVWRKIFWFLKKKEEVPQDEPVEEKTFSQYIQYVPQILTWFRREKGIPRKDLKLTVIDDEEQPAWKISQVLEILITDLNLLYLITEREEVFEELADEAYEEYGLLILIREKKEEETPGNLVLDLRDWEKHLDIIYEVSYNTLTI